MGGSGTVKLTAMLHRLHWVSGQRCFAKVLVTNNTTRTLKSFTLTLIRRTTVFKSSAVMNIDGRDDPDACQTNTSYKEVAQSTLETTHRVIRGYAGSRGWWTGVNPGEKSVFSHCLLIPVSLGNTSHMSTPDKPSLPIARCVVHSSRQNPRSRIQYPGSYLQWSLILRCVCRYPDPGCQFHIPRYTAICSRS